MSLSNEHTRMTSVLPLRPLPSSVLNILSCLGREETGVAGRYAMRDVVCFSVSHD